MLHTVKAAFVPLFIFGVFSMSSSQDPRQDALDTPITQPVSNQCALPAPELHTNQSETEDVIYFVNCGGFF